MTCGQCGGKRFIEFPIFGDRNNRTLKYFCGCESD